MKDSLISRLIPIFLICVGAVLTLSFQQPPNQTGQQDDELRDIGRSSWKDRRAGAPGGTSAKKGPSTEDKTTTSTNSIYKIITKMPKGVSQSALTADAELGITLWELRPSSGTDAIEIKDLVQPPGGGPKQEWTPERVESDAEFSEGQMVRLTIESLRPGYLYVINRTKYADGSYGDPYLIFPTQRMYGGKNSVSPKQTIQLPGPNDVPDYFELQRGKTQKGLLKVSEELIIIVKPEPFESFKIAPPDRKLLTQQSVDALIAKYKLPFECSEMKEGAGKAITTAEKKAAKESALLDENDPYPQTIYRLAARHEDAMLVTIQLKVHEK